MNTNSDKEKISTLYQLSNLPKSILTGKPVLHFSHANGMPSKVYQPIFDILNRHFSIEYIPLLGATEGYDVDDNWYDLTTQVIDSVSQACHKHNVISVVALGHSLGALCTLQAVYRVPDLFIQAILLDPPLIYGKPSLIMHVAKQLDSLPKMNHRCMDKLSPSGLSKYRRDVWNSREEAKESFEGKKFFAKFDSRCFEGYIQHGITERADGKYTLAIPKENEVKVFRTNPSWYWLTPNKPPKKPISLVVGKESKFNEMGFPAMIKKRLTIPFVIHDGGHMFPLEYPDSVAELVLQTYVKQSHL